MGISFKEIVQLVTPPIFIQLAKRILSIRKKNVEWEYIPEAWAYAATHPNVKGWNVQEILEVYKKKWPQFVQMVQGTGPLGMVHESTLSTNMDINSHNAMMAFGYSLALAAYKKDQISILDWGGGIGHYYLLARSLLPNVQIEYHCMDVPILSNYGAKLFPTQNFYSNESCFERQYDFVLASTSMHYVQDWQMLLKRLANATSKYLYVANLPSVQEASSFVFIQRPYHYGYNTEYLAWCLNQGEFLSRAKSYGLELLREFVYGYQPVIKNAPEQNIYRGFLFKAQTNGVP